MNFLEPSAITNVLVGASFLFGGWLLKVKPPKNINGLYGYRTTRSMKSQEAWDFAQVFGGSVMFQTGIALLAIGLVFIFIPIPMWLSLCLTLIPLILATVFMIKKAENELKKRFG
jgi:uncharacterized membrane protein